MQPNGRQIIIERDHKRVQTHGARRRRERCRRNGDRVSTVKEGEKYRIAAQRLRVQAHEQPDHAIGEQFRKIADRYDELAEQVEAAIRRAD